VPDWTDRIVSLFSAGPSELCFVADPDNLVSARHLREVLERLALEIIRYEDPVAFRYRYEADLRARLRRPDTPGVIVNVGDLPERQIPYDMLCLGRYVRIGLHLLFPMLNSVALADLSRDDLDRVASAYALYDGDVLGERATREFLLRDVYGVAPTVLTQRPALIGYLVQRHYAGEVLPESLDAILAEWLGPSMQLGMDVLTLLRQPEQFFRWLQAHWNDYVHAGSGHALRESAVPFAAPPIRAYLTNLFAEGQLQRTRLDGGAVPGWMRPGVLLPGDEPEQEFRDALQTIDGSWPAAVASYRDWLTFAWRWAGVRARLAALPADPGPFLDELHEVQTPLEVAFRTWLLAHYRGLSSLAVTTTPVLVHHIATVLRNAHGRGERVALVVVDGLALDHWLTLRGDIKDASWAMQETACLAWVPTLTTISRQAIFAGRAPYYFPESWNTTEREEQHWRRLGNDWGLTPSAVHFHKCPLSLPGGTDDLAAIPQAEDPRLRLLGLVLNDVDQLTHHATLGLPEMQRNVRAWAARGRLRRLVAGLLSRGFTVYLSADHGSVEAVGAGQPREGALVEQRGERARVYSEPAFAEMVLAAYPQAERWPGVDLPAGLEVVVAKGHAAFASMGEEVVAHGGIAVEEVVVPFVRIGQQA